MNKQTIRKIDAQIERIDSLIDKLLDGIDLTELTTNERLTIASRFMALSQRGMALRQTCELDQPENRENLLIAAFMRQMRGEIQSSEALRIIESPREENDGPND